MVLLLWAGFSVIPLTCKIILKCGPSRSILIKLPLRRTLQHHIVMEHKAIYQSTTAVLLYLIHLQRLAVGVVKEHKLFAS